MLSSRIDERMAELIRRNMFKATSICIMQTHRCNFYPHIPQLLYSKTGFTGLYITFPIFSLKHRSWVCTHSLCFREKYRKKDIKIFLVKIVIFTVVKRTHSLCFRQKYSKKDITIFHVQIVIFTVVKRTNSLCFRQKYSKKDITIFQVKIVIFTVVKSIRVLT